MVEKKNLFSFMEKGLSESGSPQTEISVISKMLRVVRFANSIVHQPMEDRDVTFFVRVIRDGKLGYSSFNGFDPKKLNLAVKKAEEKAALVHSTPFLDRFALPVFVPEENGYVKSTAETDTNILVDRVRLLFDNGKGTGATFAGVFWSLAGEIAVLNSNGVKLYHPFTAANCQAVATKGDLSGFSAEASSDVREIHPERVGEAAIHRALRFQESREIPPGEYQCLLEEYAVADLIFYLSYLAFTAESLEEGKSILGLKKGGKITDESVSIWDDGSDPLTFGLPFDVEGVPRKKVVFVDKGIGGEVVHDLFTAHRFQTESTGHALPFHYGEGPSPLNIEMAAGDSSKEEMLRKMKRGLLVTRFHYIREVHPLKTMVTGMTRDGLFLVENGEIVARAKNLRFTESILKALSSVSAISKDRKLVTSGEGEMGLPMATLAPKVLVDRFLFTGATQF